MPLATGQTTQYSSELDDGYYEKGLAKSYTVLTAGQYASTVNVDCIHYTAATIGFQNVASSIGDSANGLAIFQTGDVIVITGSVSNNGVYTVATGGIAGAIIVNEAIVDEAAGATVSIAKREAMSNNCVLDNNTGLMWARYQNTKFGSTSTGKMPWTGQLYDIFQFAAAANAALLGGYSDWRIPNALELIGLVNFASASWLPDTTAFPVWGSPNTWVATTNANTVTNADYLNVTAGYHTISNQAKTAEHFCTLVRG